MVHLALIVSFLTAILSAIFLSKKYLGNSGVTNHAMIGLLFLVFVIVHLTQRRQTVRRLLSRLVAPSGSKGLRSGLAFSDTVLSILTLNAMVSGAADFLVGHEIYVSVPGPFVIHKWHVLSVVVLLGYVVAHVARRRKRLQTSRVR